MHQKPILTEEEFRDSGMTQTEDEIMSGLLGLPGKLDLTRLQTEKYFGHDGRSRFFERTNWLAKQFATNSSDMSQVSTLPGLVFDNEDDKRGDAVGVDYPFAPIRPEMRLRPLPTAAASSSSSSKGSKHDTNKGKTEHISEEAKYDSEIYINNPFLEKHKIVESKFITPSQSGFINSIGKAVRSSGHLDLHDRASTANAAMKAAPKSIKVMTPSEMRRAIEEKRALEALSKPTPDKDKTEQSSNSANTKDSNSKTEKASLKKSKSGNKSPPVKKRAALGLRSPVFKGSLFIDMDAKYLADAARKKADVAAAIQAEIRAKEKAAEDALIAPWLDSGNDDDHSIDTLLLGEATKDLFLSLDSEALEAADELDLTMARTMKRMEPKSSSPSNSPEASREVEDYNIEEDQEKEELLKKTLSAIGIFSQNLMRPSSSILRSPDSSISTMRR